jgi:hypothetical protein
MKTGDGITDTYQAHRMAIVTGATTVLLQDLCQDMFTLVKITGDKDMAGIAKACASKLIHSPKCREIEVIVDAVLEHDDGMPDIPNRALLAEIMACYSAAARAERTGSSAQFRQTLLVPAIVAQAMDTVAPEGDAAVSFVNSINQYHSAWDSYLPCTPFQFIVRDAINSIAI